MRLIIKDGCVHSVYHDSLPSLALGPMTTTRASSVEFNPVSQEWEAVLPDGTLIAKGQKRGEVIQAEVIEVERRLISTLTK
jgi:hypothetical protein